MHLKTLGGLELVGSDFGQKKPLLLLAYLCLEGPQDRRHLAELFWPSGVRPMANLTTVLARLRKIDEGLIEADDATIRAGVLCDVTEFLETAGSGAYGRARDLYRGRFLEGFYLKDVGAELEEWVYGRRESIAGRMRHVHRELAETSAAAGDLLEAARLAERAYLQPGAAEPEEVSLERLHALLVAGGSHLAGDVRREAEGFGLDLSITKEQAVERLVQTDGDVARAPTYELPVYLTPFIGREQEVDRLSAQLRDSGCRLLSLIGPGGIGKTRLSIAIAERLAANEEFSDGICFISFVSAASTELMIPALGDALFITFSGQIEPKDQLLNHLRDRDVLLVLDNLEHLLDGADLLRGLLEAASKVKLLVTSREPLNLQAEHIFDLSGLAVPVEMARAGEYDAVRLFLQSARRRRSDFTFDDKTLEPVVQICRLVGGMPLAIELAASWLRALPVADIAEELEAGLDLLEASTRDLPERHQSVRTVFDHSWALLREREREVLKKLSVFQGGFRREAAAKVAGATLPMLARLVDKSLLRMTPEGRYDLHPLLHQYTRERLSENPQDLKETQQRHAAYFIRILEQQELHLGGSESRQPQQDVEQELVNIAAAWDWAVSQLQANILGRCAQPLVQVFQSRAQEAISLLSRGLQMLMTLPHTVERDKQELHLLTALGVPTIKAAGYGSSQTEEVNVRASAIARKLGRPPGPQVLRALALFSLLTRDTRRALELSSQLLRTAQHEDNLVVQVEGHYLTGVTLFWRGEFLSSCEHLKQAVDLYEPSNHRMHIALFGQDSGVICLARLAFVLWFLGYPDQAIARCQEAMELAHELAHPFSLCYAATMAAWLHTLLGDHVAAQEHAALIVAVSREYGFPIFMGLGAMFQGWVQVQKGETEAGLVQIREGIDFYQQAGGYLYDTYAQALVALAVSRNRRLEEGLVALTETLDEFGTQEDRWFVAELHRLKGEMLILSGDTSARAEASLRKALDVARTQQARMLEIRAANSLGRFWQQRGDRAEAHRLVSEVVDWFTEGQETVELLEAKALLTELSSG